MHLVTLVVVWWQVCLLSVTEAMLDLSQKEERTHEKEFFPTGVFLRRYRGLRTWKCCTKSQQLGYLSRCGLHFVGNH